MLMPGVLEFSPPGGVPAPVVVDSPHSGSLYPPHFRSEVTRDELRRLEDAHVHTLFGAAPAAGASWLHALFARAYIDPNRAVDDIDPGTLADDWAGRLRPSQKALLGVGLVFTRTPAGAPIYARRLRAAEVRARIEQCYLPYHQTLSDALAQSASSFGFVWHLNCHSMPAYALSGPLGQSARRPDFCLGDRQGTSCTPELTALVSDFLRARGYSVSVNVPYAGVEIVKRYGQPRLGSHSLQMEINRDLYMDEDSGRAHTGFQPLAADLTALLDHLCERARTRAGARVAGLAAE